MSNHVADVGSTNIVQAMGMAHAPPVAPSPNAQEPCHVAASGMKSKPLGRSAAGTTSDATVCVSAASVRVMFPTANVLAAGGGGVQDRAEVARRDDVLVFESAPLDKPISVGGNVRAQLWVMSSAVDTDFTAHLVDVEPGGYCVPVADGIQRARYRNSVEVPEFLTPNEPTELTIDLWDTAYTFAADHRIRLEISSSSFPRWSRNANAAVQPEKAQPDDLVVATNTVLFGPYRPSHLVLPTVS